MNKKPKNKTWIYSTLGGFLFSIAMILGKAVYEHNTVEHLVQNHWHLARTILQIILLTILGTSVCIFSWNMLEKISYCTKNQKEQWKFFKSRYFFPLCWLITFLAWLPCYLSYYPGILSYDSNVQTLMARRIWTWTTHHPPIHTFLWKACLSAGPRLGIEPITVYAILQMLVLSGCLSIVVKYMIDRKCNNVLITFTLMFYTLNPVIAIFSFVMTKDIYFASFLAVTSVTLLEMIREPHSFVKKPICYITFIVSATLSCMLRNNFIYVYILLLPILFYILRKKCKRCILIAIAPIVIAMTISQTIYPMVGIVDGDTKESMSVPMQQIALVAEKENLSDELRQEIHRFIPDTSVYNLRFADPIKFVFSESEFKENKAEFFSLWWRMLKDYPIEFIDAFLSLNIPLWYPDTEWNDAYSEREYIETYIYQGSYTFERRSLFPNLNMFYEKIAEGTVLECIPIFSALFSLNTPVWILIYTILYLLSRKNINKICVPVMCLLLWATYIVGPVSCLRYIFPIMILYPLFVWIWFDNDTLLYNNTVVKM